MWAVGRIVILFHLSSSCFFLGLQFRETTVISQDWKSSRNRLHSVPALLPLLLQPLLNRRYHSFYFLSVTGGTAPFTAFHWQEVPLLLHPRIFPGTGRATNFTPLRDRRCHFFYILSGTRGTTYFIPCILSGAGGATSAFFQGQEVPLLLHLNKNRR